MPRSNGTNVVWVTGKCRGSPGTAYGCAGSTACIPGAQVGLSNPGWEAGSAPDCGQHLHHGWCFKVYYTYPTHARTLDICNSFCSTQGQYDLDLV